MKSISKYQILDKDKVIVTSPNNVLGISWVLNPKLDQLSVTLSEKFDKSITYSTIICSLRVIFPVIVVVKILMKNMSIT